MIPSVPVVSYLVYTGVPCERDAIMIYLDITRWKRVHRLGPWVEKYSYDQLRHVTEHDLEPRLLNIEALYESRKYRRDGLVLKIQDLSIETTSTQCC